MITRLLFAILLAATPLSAQVVINEFMADNVTSPNTDEDGQINDWLELQNNGPTSVSLNGWYLTDDAGDLQKWRFPVTAPVVSLASGARLVVWCSNKNRKANVTKLHTNFKLSASGEYLALVRADGITVEHSYAPMYPPQIPNGTYGLGNTVTTTVVFAEGGAGKAKVAATASDFTTNFNTPANAWTTTSYTDTTWQAGDSGFGFGNPFTGLIGTGGDVLGIMKPAGGPNNGSCFLRFPFTVSSLSGIQAVRLRIKYDDAYAFYINGTFIGKSGFAPSALAWNSVTTSGLDRSDASASTFEIGTLINGSGPLVVGDNILGIQVINNSASGTNALCRPQLEVDVSGAPIAGYLATSTRGAANSSVTTVIGPFINNTTDQVPRPGGGVGSAELVISTKVTPTLRPLATTSPVVLKYRIMYGVEPAGITMLDDGAGAAGASGDLVAGDSIYTCKVPTTALTAGQMIRWRIEAKDNGATATYAYDPPYLFNATTPPANPPPVNLSSDLDQYYGTVALDGIATSNLPILHWFAQTPANADGASGESCSFFFQPISKDNPPVGYIQPPGRFYDNIPVNLHGQSSGGFPQKSHNMSFNKLNRFKWKDGLPECQGVNLLTTYADKTKLRNTLAWGTWGESGHLASHFSQPLRVQQNAAFRGLYDLVEDANRGFLEREGLDPERGSLYKVYNSLENGNVASGNGGGSEKKNPDDGDYSELVAFTAGIADSRTMTDRLKFTYDNVDLASLINFWAVHSIILGRDFGHKNYYVFRDTGGTLEWSPLPWDQDLSFGHTWTSGNGYFDDDMHSQAPVQIGVTSNRLLQITYGTNELNSMFVARMRTLMNQFYVSGTETNGPFEQKINSLLNLIDSDPNNPATGSDDADLNARKWGFWVDTAGAQIAYTDSRMADHTVRAQALRVLSSNPVPPYPGANPYGNWGDGSTSMLPFLPGRRAFLFSTPAPTSGTLPIPATPPANPTLIIESIVFNPTTGVPSVLPTDLDTQAFEYFIIRNPNNFAVDISGWTLTGEISMTFRGGTVIPAQGTTTTQGTNSAYVNQLIVANKPQGFRQRTASPTNSEYRYVCGPYKGQLSARGGSIILSRPNNLMNPAAGYTQIATASYTGVPTQSQQFLRITELNYHPSNPTPAELLALPGVTDSDFEFIEVTNTSGATLNLAGARFDRGVDFTFPATAVATIAPGERRIVVANLAAFRLRYGNGLDALLLGEWLGNLDNSGEEIQLVDPLGEVVLEFSYNDTWYPPTDGGGYSLVTRVEATSHTAFGNPSAWAISGSSIGSPGADDTSYGTHYTGWRWDHYTEAELTLPSTLGDLNGDDDGDGMNNFTEFAFGRLPRVADNPGALTVGGTVNDAGTNYLCVTFRRAKNALDVTYTIEANSDLTNAAGWANVGVLVSATDLGNGTEEVCFRDTTPMGTTPRYIRVRAVKP